MVLHDSIHMRIRFCESFRYCTAGLWAVAAPQLVVILLAAVRAVRTRLSAKHGSAEKNVAPPSELHIWPLVAAAVYVTTHSVALNSWDLLIFFRRFIRNTKGTLFFFVFCFVCVNGSMSINVHCTSDWCVVFPNFFLFGRWCHTRRSGFSPRSFLF